MTDLFPDLYKGSMSPPFNTQALNPDKGGVYSDSWEAHHQSVVDVLHSVVNTDFKGVVDGSEAAAGDIGEVLLSDVPPGSSLPSGGTVSAVTSLDLTPGDWDVSGSVKFIAGTSLHLQLVEAGIGMTATDLGPVPTSLATDFASGAASQIATGPRRSNSAATVTVYLTAAVVSTGGGGVSVSGVLRARRMR